MLKKDFSFKYNRITKKGTMEFNDKYIEISFNQKNVDSFFKPSASSGIGGYGLHLYGGNNNGCISFYMVSPIRQFIL